MATEINDTGADKDAAPKWSPQIIIAIVSVIGGVLVAFIGVLPQLRSQDATTIGKLEQQVSQLKLSLVGESKTPPPPPRPLQITGTVMDSSGARPLGWAEVFLVPQDKPKHIGTTGPDGSFTFPDVPSNQRYRIVVRDSATGKMTVGDIDEDGRVAKLAGVIVNYRVDK